MPSTATTPRPAVKSCTAEQREALGKAIYDEGNSAQEAVELAANGELAVPAFKITPAGAASSAKAWHQERIDALMGDDPEKAEAVLWGLFDRAVRKLADFERQDRLGGIVKQGTRLTDWRKDLEALRERRERKAAREAHEPQPTEAHSPTVERMLREHYGDPADESPKANGSHPPPAEPKPPDPPIERADPPSPKSARAWLEENAPHRLPELDAIEEAADCADPSPGTNGKVPEHDRPAWLTS